MEQQFQSCVGAADAAKFISTIKTKSGNSETNYQLDSSDICESTMVSWWLVYPAALCLSTVPVLHHFIVF